MNILIFQSQHSDPEINKYRESQNFRRAFNRRGCHAEVYTPETKIADFDVFLVLENYEFNQVPDLSAYPQKKLLWVIDSHKNAPELNKFIERNKIGTTLVAFKNHLNLFPNPVWFPPAAPADLCMPLKKWDKKYGIGFCGSRGNRGTELDWLTQTVNLKQDIFVLGDAMVRAINSYRIHFNKNETPDVLAFRTMETLACGTMLLTDESGNVEDLFENHEHLVVYKTMEKAEEYIKYYLKFPNLVEEIAEAGRQEFLSKHTYDDRAAAIEELI